MVKDSKIQNELDEIIKDDKFRIVKDGKSEIIEDDKVEVNINGAESSLAKEEELKALKAELDGLQEFLEKKSLELQTKSEELQKRALSIKEREDAISQKEKKHELDLKQKQIEAKTIFEEKLANEKAESLARISTMLSEKMTEFEKKITAEENVRRMKLEKELTERKKQAENELTARRRNIETELNNLKVTADSDIQAKKKEFEEKLTERKKQVESDISSYIDRRTKEVAVREKNVASDEKTLREKEKDLDEREEKLYEREKEIELANRKNERERKRLENKKDELDSLYEDLNEEIAQRMGEKLSLCKNEIKVKNDELEKMRNELARYIVDMESVKTFKSIYGDDPQILEKERKEFINKINDLQEKLSNAPEKEIELKYNSIKREYEETKAELEDLRRKNEILLKEQEKVEILKIEKERTVSENNELKTSVTELTQRCARYEEKINRLSSSEMILADRDQRIKEITNDYTIDMFGAGLPNCFTEIEWLDYIYNSCEEYGITFSRRILYSFHTALKISDWSSITILAGVSGTGKSELPKLYSAFGGLNFISVPVQPSWDSQESMLGFFNSIDNKFEPEELLSFLVECTENEDYHKYMSIVLLDEMNLAHVEHYFADFLSKLETRRGTSKDKVPTIDVKLGAGVTPYKLKLDRSVLWTGTMNQDETTKSLSDKVLDRGIVINFPRPKKLSSRTTMKILSTMIENSGRPMLERRTWGKWIVRKIDLVGEQAKEMDKYKEIVEEINGVLEKVGRALGHRVWQSIEYYIVNYPTVVEERKKLTTEEVDQRTNKVKKVSTGELSSALASAMKTAFEDQIVQKIMPKLRGIETRGKGRENLQKIEDLLEVKGFENLKDDFETACEQGYGQFIWSSAKYIEAEEEAYQVSEAKNTSEN